MSVLRRKVVRDLLERKLSIVSLLAIVAVGVGCYVGMSSVYRDLDGARARYYAAYRLSDLSVELKRAPITVLDAVRRLPNVREVYGRVNVQALIDLPGAEPISGTVLSLPLTRRPVLNDVLLRSGTWFSRDEGQVILNEAFARANGLRPGDRLRVTLLDRRHDLLVVGTAMSPEFVYLIPRAGGIAPDPARFGVLYLPEPFLRRAVDQEGAVNQVLALTHDASRPAVVRTLERIRGILEPHGVTLTTPSVDMPSVSFLADELMGLKVSATVTPALFLGVAALVLNLLLGRLVTQQRTIVGTLKGLGYTSSAITRHYLGYGLVVGGLGGLLGGAFGRWVQGSLVQLYKQFYSLPNIETNTYADIYAWGFLVSLACALLGTLKGVHAASSLEPAEAMRPPPPERGGRVLPERVGFLWRRLSFRSKMILRAAFRNPFRSSVNVLASAVATALIVSSLATVDGLEILMHYEFEEVSHQDLAVAVRDPEGRLVASELEALPLVVETEAELHLPCELRRGSLVKRVGVFGIAPGNRLRTPLDRAGRPIKVPAQGLVISQKLAEILELVPGDRVRMRPLIGERREVEVTIAATVETYLGLAVYTDLSCLSRQVGEAWVANLVLARVRKQHPLVPLMFALKQRPAVIGVDQRTRSLSQLEETFGESMGAMIGILVLFSGLIAFGSVLNTTLVSLSERRREVGTLRVLGFSPLQVAWVFSGESLLLSSLGIGLGLLGGIGLAHAMASAYSTELYRFPAQVSLARHVQSALMMLGFVICAQVLVYRMIARMDWLAALQVKE